MLTRPFAWTGIQVPVIGQGTWMVENDTCAIASLRSGLDLGMTHIDTAEMYGNGRAEEVVAEAIAGRRQEVFLVSKVLPSNASYSETLRACERSLARLKTDWLDLYLLHWKGRYPVADTMRAMEKLAEEGSIRFIGVSNFDLADVQQAESALRHHRLACNQVLYHLGERGIERKLLPYCAGRQISVVAYSPFGHGGGLPKKRVLADVAAKHGRTARQVVLNWVTRHPAVFAIPKSGNPEHTRENAGGTGWQLDPEDLAAIDRAFPAPDRDMPLGMI